MGGPGSGRSSKVIRRTRPQTTLYCRFRSKRKPLWSEADAARTCCAAIKNGGTMRQINARVQTLCPTGKPADDDVEGTVSQVAVEVRQVLEETDGVLGDAFTTFLVINALLGAFIILVSRFRTLPGLRVIAGRALTQQAAVSGLLTRIVGSRKAANDAIFQLNVVIARGKLAA